MGDRFVCTDAPHCGILGGGNDVLFEGNVLEHLGYEVDVRAAPLRRSCISDLLISGTCSDGCICVLDRLCGCRIAAPFTPGGSGSSAGTSCEGTPSAMSARRCQPTLATRRLRHLFVPERIILPRQARDKHRGKKLKNEIFGRCRPTLAIRRCKGSIWTIR